MASMEISAWFVTRPNLERNTLHTSYTTFQRQFHVYGFMFQVFG